MPSGDLTQAQALYKSGMDLYGKQRYEEAMSAFDRAISLGDRTWKVMDAKAATMNRMGGAWQQSAFELASTLCKKYGDKSYKPWFRAASILVSMNLLDAAERNITKGLSLATDAPSRKVFIELRATAERTRAKLAAARATTAAEAEAERLAAAKAAMCFTHLLPPDILLLIAKAGADTDAAMPLRMAGVCAEWRGVMLSHGPLWNHIKLGRRRPVAKLVLWKERSNGRIKRVTITNRMPREHHRAVADILAPLLSGVEELVLHGDIDEFVVKWQGRCLRLKSLVVKNTTNMLLPFLCEILHPDASELHTVDWGSVLIPPSGSSSATKRGYLGREDLWLPNPAVQLKSLRKLRIGNGQVAEGRMWLPSLLEHAPKITEVELGCTWDERHTPTGGEVTTLHALTRLELRDTAGMPTPSEHLYTPNLTSFSCFGWMPFQASTIDNLRGPGMAPALPILVSLDIGRCAFTQQQLLELLPDLVSLRFLNVSFGALDNGFLEALVVEPGRKPLLPSLTALSIAGHDTMSAGPLRRMVLSRRPDIGAARPALPPVAPTPKRSAFALVRSAFAPARPKPTPQVSQPSQTSDSSQTETRPAVAAITWLCLDQCNHPDMDVRVLEQLRKYLRFVSNHNGPVVVDRIRGRGQYAWDRDGDWDAACGSGSGGCHLKKRRADSDGWYVHHTCKRAHVEEKEQEKV
ncbi:hypothetical protein Q8F55_004643 [Vanrija albida]|uniref:F-box domain-containing protein n=1 Tax=Vanrija albida TaxID=181172 RepID=A0ABR3Q863_9TREE